MDKCSCNIEEECEKIRDYLKTELRRGDFWYLIYAVWFKNWKKYVGFDRWDQANKGDSDTHPGPIDNLPLMEGDGVLKDHLIDELDYVLLPKDAWNLLQQKYGTASGDKDAIQRQVIEQGMFVKHCKVEVYLLQLKLTNSANLQKYIQKDFSRTDIIESVELAMRDEFGLSDEKEVRLWNNCMSNTYEQLSKPDQTLEEEGLYSGQIIIIETRNKDGSWPRGGSGEGFRVTKERRQRINEEKEKRNQVSKTHSNIEVQAQELVSCDQNACEQPSQLFCNLCLENICTNCAGLHLLRKSQYGHDVVEHKNRKLRGPFLYCQSHEHTTCELYCKQCNVPLCSKCLFSNLHKGHDFIDISNVLDAQKACIGQERDEMKSIIQKLEEFKTKLDTKSKDREQIYKNLDNEVNNREKDMMAALKNAVTKQKQRIEELKTLDQNQLKAEKDKIDQHITKARENLENCNRLLDGQNPSRLLQFGSKISDLQKNPGTIPDMNEFLFRKGPLSIDDLSGGFGDIELKQTS